nr:uncharacterized protein [Tanacetum cinerariifolium]
MYAYLAPDAHLLNYNVNVSCDFLNVLRVILYHVFKSIWQLSMRRSSDELRIHANLLFLTLNGDVKHYIGANLTFLFRYLELAIFPCWRFLDDHVMDKLMRLVMMIRGIVDPLASAYCRFFLVHRDQKLPKCDT